MKLVGIFQGLYWNIQHTHFDNFLSVATSENSFKACVRYFSLFLKEKLFLFYFEQSTLKRNLTYSCFFFPSFHEHSLSLELQNATYLLKTSCFEKRAACVIKTMLTMQTFSQMKKSRREVNQQTKQNPR